MRTENTKISYYAIAGSNGYGIYTDLTKAQESACYIKNCVLKKFHNLKLAKQWANEKFLRSQPVTETFLNIQPISSLNWCYFKNNK